MNTAFDRMCHTFRGGGSIVWNSASHFFNDSMYPSRDYSFRYNTFIGCVLDEIAAEGVNVDRKYREHFKPQHNLDSIIHITKKQGFATTQIGSYLVPYDLQFFLRNHLVGVLKELILDDISDEKKQEVISKGISRAIIHHDALVDMDHKWDINPVFISKMF